jgi:ABC-type phosphonate transport system ATPase subunit
VVEETRLYVLNLVSFETARILSSAAPMGVLTVPAIASLIPLLKGLASDMDVHVSEHNLAIVVSAGGNKLVEL